MQQPGPQEWYHARAFAELAGITVRTLHLYDQLGLLKPRRRSARGYRLYQMQDLERAEQIVALKFLGLPLSAIRRLLDGEPPLLLEELTRQHEALLEKRRLIDRALVAIGDAQHAIRQGKPTAELLRRIIETIQMQSNTDWIMKYYSPAARAKLTERAATFTPEMQAQISEAWKEYYRDLAAFKEQHDPDGAKAAELSRRHGELLAAFTGNDPDIEAGLTALYRDRENWPADLKERMMEYESTKP